MESCSLAPRPGMCPHKQKRLLKLYCVPDIEEVQAMALPSGPGCTGDRSTNGTQRQERSHLLKDMAHFSHTCRRRPTVSCSVPYKQPVFTKCCWGDSCLFGRTALGPRIPACSPGQTLSALPPGLGSLTEARSLGRPHYREGLLRAAFLHLQIAASHRACEHPSSGWAQIQAAQPQTPADHGAIAQLRGAA